MLESFVKLTDVNEVNVSREERWASLAGGAILLIYAMVRIPLSALLAAVAATYLLFRGIRGFCYFYDRLGMNTAVDLPLVSPIKNNHQWQTAVTSPHS